MDDQLENWLENHGIYVRTNVDIREVCYDMDQHQENGCLFLDTSAPQSNAESNDARDSVSLNTRNLFLFWNRPLINMSSYVQLPTLSYRVPLC